MSANKEMHALLERRETAVQKQDLVEAIRLDDQLEDLGLPTDDRRTCYSCQTWFDHAHNPLTGRRMTWDEYRSYQQEITSIRARARYAVTRNANHTSVGA
ncbi:CysS/YqeB C-terminal domain-containing protein [Mycobacteroides abscessus]|uniref:CysS/YqeB C-terminal domain-containing protein n=1 Tax=Mycobacteroides abscessus TaxID=36809 RepID=UPI0009A71398|nr:hypothetical protein [Mycobacteroides abscessus]SKO15316.1 Uncharacterised protein [Mycobacteroides abscessus subsp. bolletii]SKX37379.1 Uncharacterised protein [Mycobacteroides abscessus subsp. bolletii]